VAVRYENHALSLEIRDDGKAPSADGDDPPRTGRGLIGIRERVALVGGQLETGPAPLGGFVVRCRLPVPEDAP
jgi:signal transduction histidine kinase